MPEKCLTIRQPWTELILRGWKDVENRTWSTKYRGRILLHAAAKIDDSPDIWQWCENEGIHRNGVITRHLVGYCTLVDVTKERSSEWHEEDHFGWYLTDVVRFDQPIKMRGKLGLYEVSDEIVKRFIK